MESYTRPMSAAPERLPNLTPKEPLTYEGILHLLPDAVNFARVETDSIRLAQTAEGKFALSYLFANRNLLKPVLVDFKSISPDLLQPIGGAAHNPERRIDSIGSAVARVLSQESDKIPGLFMRTEESADWESLSTTNTSLQEGERFAVIDPLDMTSSITRGDRVQTTGIAMYDREGEIKALGIMSLVDDGFIFIENVDGKFFTYSTPERDSERLDNEPLRVAAKTRRMYTLKDSPLMQGNTWSLNCDSGFAALTLQEGKIDTIVDHIKGSLWYEVVIWARALQILGFPVTDKDGNAIDFGAAMRRVIEKHEGDTYRIPFVISRTPDIHQKVLNLLQKPSE